ncbi:MAG: ATP synthase F0 subunit B [Syntrophaceae bacterium]
MIDFNYTFFYQMANFIILIVVLNFILYKPLLKILDARDEKLAASDQEVKDLNAAIEKKVAEYEEKIRQAKLEAMNQRNEIQKGGSDQAKQIIDETRAELAKIMEEFQGKLDQEISQAKLVLKNQSAGISSEIAEKVLGRRLQ